MRANGLEPLDPYAGVDAPWRCTHVHCSREVTPRYFNIKKGQSGCLYCTHEALAALFRMPEADAIAIMRDAGLEPLDPYPTSNRPWRCRHTCGHVVSPTLGNVRLGKGICRYCNSNFPFDGPASVYLVSNDHAHKIGIAGVGSDRINQHRRRGWRLTWTIEVQRGDLAWNAEQATLGWVRSELGLPEAVTAAEMPQYGATETFPTDGVTAAEVRAFVELNLAAQEEGPAGAPELAASIPLVQASDLQVVET